MKGEPFPNQDEETIEVHLLSGPIKNLVITYDFNQNEAASRVSVLDVPTSKRVPKGKKPGFT